MDHALGTTGRSFLCCSLIAICPLCNKTCLLLQHWSSTTSIMVEIPFYQYNQWKHASWLWLFPLVVTVLCAMCIATLQCYTGNKHFCHKHHESDAVHCRCLWKWKPGDWQICNANAYAHAVRLRWAFYMWTSLPVHEVCGTVAYFLSRIRYYWLGLRDIEIFFQGLTPPVLIFVQTKERAKELFSELIYDGINVDVIHADRTQLQVSHAM